MMLIDLADMQGEDFDDPMVQVLKDGVRCRKICPMKYARSMGKIDHWIAVLNSDISTLCC